MRFRLFSFLFVFLSFLFLLPNYNIINAKVLFEDDFDDGDLGKWEIIRNECDFNSNWAFESGRYGIQLNSTHCVTETVPADSYWNDDWDDYIVEFDMYPENGFIKNVVWRVANVPNWVGIQFAGGSVNVQRATKIFSENEFGLVNGHVYHMRFEIIGDEFNVYYYDYDNPDHIAHIYAEPYDDFRKHGKPGLQASRGAEGTDVVYFDNFVVSDIDDRLDVEHFSQKNPVWKDEEYDDSSSHNPVGWQEIEDWGCAMTSAAMVLDFYGYEKGPDGIVTNPSNLNQWLKDNDGYNKYGSVVWSAISNYAQEATKSAEVDDDLPQLEFSYLSYSENALQDEIEATRPAILKVVMNNKGTAETDDDNLHFVTARGYEDGRIDINDPLDLEDTEATISGKYEGKELRQIASFVPSHTDLSYLWLYQYNSGVNTLLEIDGKKIGVDGEGVEWNEIPGAQAYYEGSIGLPPLFEDNLGNGSYVILVPKPESGKYTITFSDDTGAQADYELFVFDVGADSRRFAGQISLGVSGKELLLDFDKGDSSQAQLELVSEEVDFGELLRRIDVAYDQGWIAQKWVAKRLENIVQVGKYMYEKNRIWLAKFHIVRLERVLRINIWGLISQDGVEYLENSIVLLKEGLDW